MNPGPDFDFPPPSDIDALLDQTEVADTNDRNWRPICERYQEFMEGQWILDKVEEQEALAGAAEREEKEQADNEKKEQRAKKRKQAETKRKGKKAAKDPTPLPAPLAAEEMRLGSYGPSPLRHEYVGDEYRDEASPLPAGLHSGYSSEVEPVNTDTPDLEA
jgi:COMPASS component BRE2